MNVVILDRNKQYFVKEGDIIKIDSINLPINSDIIFDNVFSFLDYNDENLIFKSDFIKKKIVISKILSHIKDKKKLILKFKRRKGYLRRFGHRQNYTFIKIISINNN